MRSCIPCWMCAKIPHIRLLHEHKRTICKKYSLSSLASEATVQVTSQQKNLDECYIVETSTTKSFFTLNSQTKGKEVGRSK